ncbi:MAG TPA: hypothetical protein VJX10_18780, partial [Pseudonocardiaceae bacterium]|nr:hypothetical protein [Pseudonocardiaceae bacterium]
MPGELTAIASRDGREIGRTRLATVGAPAALRLVPDVGGLTTSRDDLAYVLVEVVDGHGHVVPDAVLEVTFQVGSPGVPALRSRDWLGSTDDVVHLLLDPVGVDVVLDELQPGGRQVGVTE